jgi:hypothetical protein
MKRNTLKRARLRSATDLDFRTAAGREARALAKAIEADLGGDLTATQSVLVDRFVALSAWAVSQDVAAARGEAFDVVKRIGETLGLERKPKEVLDLRAYLARKERS